MAHAQLDINVHCLGFLQLRQNSWKLSLDPPSAEVCYIRTYLTQCIRPSWY